MKRAVLYSNMSTLPEAEHSCYPWMDVISSFLQPHHLDYYTPTLINHDHTCLALD